MTDDRCDLLCLDAPRAEAIRQKLLDEERAQEAADRARALSDPTRLTLAAALREGEELCVCDLAWISDRAQNLVECDERSREHRRHLPSGREARHVFTHV